MKPCIISFSVEGERRKIDVVQLRRSELFVAQMYIKKIAPEQKFDTWL